MYQHIATKQLRDPLPHHHPLPPSPSPYRQLKYCSTLSTDEPMAARLSCTVLHARTSKFTAVENIVRGVHGERHRAPALSPRPSSLTTSHAHACGEGAQHVYHSRVPSVAVAANKKKANKQNAHAKNGTHTPPTIIPDAAFISQRLKKKKKKLLPTQ